MLAKRPLFNKSDNEGGKKRLFNKSDYEGGGKKRGSKISKNLATWFMDDPFYYSKKPLLSYLQVGTERTGKSREIEMSTFKLSNPLQS